jgi:uncharacterized protein (TIGR02594 family)
MIETSAFLIAQRFVGIKEVKGNLDNPMILAMLNLDVSWPSHDEVPWCSAFANYVAWILRLPRSKSLLARSWLGVGIPIDLSIARADCDIVVIKRGGDDSGPENMTAPGHVGFYAGRNGNSVMILAGNQGDSVNISNFPLNRILGLRRLA